MTFDVKTFPIAKMDSLLSRGLSRGLGMPDGQMCAEAVVCLALGEPFGSEPSCVARAVRSYVIAVQDSPRWASPATIRRRPPR